MGDIWGFEEPDSVGDNMEAVFRDGVVTLTIEEPWARCTETGFGQSCSIRMDKEVALQFVAWLQEKFT